MNVIVVISLDLPDPEQVVEVIKHLNPPTIPHFAGEVRVAVGEEAAHVIEWLDA